MLNNEPPKKFAIALFHGFQALDVFGPIDALNLLSFSKPLELSILAETLDPVSTVPERLPDDSPIPNLPATGVIGQSVVPSHTYENAPEDIEVLLVPGGRGTRNLPRTQHVADFLKQRFPKLRYLLTICTGASIAARAGILDGKNATTNKMAFDWVRNQSKGAKTPQCKGLANVSIQHRWWPKAQMSSGLAVHVGYGRAISGLPRG